MIVHSPANSSEDCLTISSPSGSSIYERNSFETPYPNKKAFMIAPTYMWRIASAAARSIRRHELKGLYEGGRHLPISVLGLDITGEDVHEPG